MNIYMAVLFIATIFSAGSQVLLKQSARQEHKSWIYEYLNWRVITAYAISFGVLFSTTFAYTKVDMRFGPVIDTLTYVFVMVFSYFLLREQFTKGQLIGNLIIIAGVLIYTL
ncbi:MAG: multidrug ABC transporter [Clostridiales bacterium]|nr:multidrug ABC transporter [Clostridiales bacterium]